jgi:hypothetical protein
MVKRRPAVAAPLLIVVLAVLLLLAILTEARPALAPALTGLPAPNTQVESSAAATGPKAGPAAASPRAVTASQPTEPASVPVQSAAQAPQAPASSQCGPAGSGLPCVAP